MRLGSTVGINKELIKRLYEKLKYEVTGHTFRKVLGECSGEERDS